MTRSGTLEERDLVSEEEFAKLLTMAMSTLEKLPRSQLLELVKLGHRLRP